MIEMYRLNVNEKSKRLELEQWAKTKTEELAHSFLGEVHQSAKYIRSRIKIIEETIEDSTARQEAIKSV